MIKNKESKMNPGLHTSISHDEYHADPCPTPSLAAGIADALINQTPLHAWTRHRKLNPNYQEDGDPKFDTGTAAHALLLEGIDKMCVCPFDDWRKKEAREQRDMARAEGLIPVLPKQEREIRLMVEHARAAFDDCEDLAGYSMSDGMAEHSIIWTEGDTWLRCRPDWMCSDRRILMDAKFTDTSAGPEAFAGQIARMAYDLRAAFYLRGNTATGGDLDAKYLFLVQEASEPFATCIIGMPPMYIALGNEKVEEAIRIWRECMATDRWPGYPSRIFWPDPPAWALSQWEQRQYLEADHQQRGLTDDMIELINQQA
jgi:hypothetical protein